MTPNCAICGKAIVAIVTETEVLIEPCKDCLARVKDEGKIDGILMLRKKLTENEEETRKEDTHEGIPN